MRREYMTGTGRGPQSQQYEICVRIRLGQTLRPALLPAGAGGLSRPRASHADREQVIELLKSAFVQGRLAKDEFDVRVGRVLASRTYAELDAVTADIPAGMAAVPSPQTRAGARVLKPATGTVKVVAWSAGVSTALTVPLGVIAGLTGHVAFLDLSCFAFSGAAAVAWDAMVTLAARARLGVADGPTGSTSPPPGRTRGSSPTESELAALIPVFPGDDRAADRQAGGCRLSSRMKEASCRRKYGCLA
jgi:hypothetical protein